MFKWRCPACGNYVQAAMEYNLAPLVEDHKSECPNVYDFGGMDFGPVLISSQLTAADLKFLKELKVAWEVP